MIKILFLLGFLLSSHLSFGSSTETKDIYILPEEIKIELENVLESKRKLDEYMITRFTELCMKENSQAEFFERLAYEEIFGTDCSGLLGRFIYLN